MRSSRKQFLGLLVLAATVLLSLSPLVSRAAAPAKVPDQPKLATYNSKRYTVHTNLTAEEAAPYVDHMDSVCLEYERRFSAFTPKVRKSMDLYLFRKQSEYLNFLAEHDFNGANSGGVFLYNAQLSALITWTGDRGRPECLEVLQHEGFHQFAFIYLGPNLPIWLNEGLAQYFGDALMIDGSMTIGLIRLQRLALVQRAVKEKQDVPFDQLLAMSNQEWSATLVKDPQRSALMYAQSWSIAYFLIHGGDGKYREAFERFLKLISTGKSPPAAFKDAFGATDTGPFREKWQEWLLAAKPDPITTAVSRLEFLGESLRILQAQGKKMPLKIEDLKKQLKDMRLKAMRSMHGVVTVFDAADDAMYEYPDPRGGTLPIDLIPSADTSIPPRLAAPGLKPQPILVWTRDAQGKLVMDIQYKK